MGGIATKAIPKKKTHIHIHMNTTTTTTTNRTRRSSFGGGNSTVEQQCILRVPPELATRINQILRQHDASKDPNKSIELDIDIAFGDNEDVLQFLKSALKEQVSPRLAQQPQKDENTSSITVESSSSNSEKEDGKNKSEENGTLNNTEDKIDERYISNVAYTIKKNRRGRFRFGNEMYPCELLDLPCIIEAYKSMDCKAYYKSGDVSQMILVKTQEELDKEIDRLRIEEEEDVGKKKKKDKKHLLTTFEHGLTPSTRNIAQHWERQRSDISKHDIAMMFDRFMQLLEEENPENVKLEILEDTGEEMMEEFSSEEDEEDSDLETDSSFDSDQEESISTGKQREPAISSSDRYASPLYSTPTVLSPTPSTVKTPVSVMDEDSKSMASVEEDEQMFESIMNEETSSNQGEEPEEDTKSVTTVEEDEEMFESIINEETSSPDEKVEVTIPEETAARVDRSHLIERRNIVTNELNEKQRELAEKERQAASTPNLIMRRRFETQIAEKQREVENKKQELAQIEEQLNSL